MSTLDKALNLQHLASSPWSDNTSPLEASPTTQFPKIACNRSTGHPAIFQDHSLNKILKIYVFCLSCEIVKSCSRGIFYPAQASSFSLRLSPAASQHKAVVVTRPLSCKYSKAQYAQFLKKYILPVLRNSRSCGITAKESSLRSFSSRIQLSDLKLFRQKQIILGLNNH